MKCFHYTFLKMGQWGHRGCWSVTRGQSPAGTLRALPSPRARAPVRQGKEEMRWWFSRSTVSDSCNPLDCSLPGSSALGILQARMQEWVTISSSRIFLTQGSNLHLLHCRWILHWLSHQGSPPLAISGRRKQEQHNCSTSDPSSTSTPSPIQCKGESSCILVGVKIPIDSKG